MAADWWRFLPRDGRQPGADALLESAAEGQGALTRLLRDMRAGLGSTRTAALLASAEASAGRRFGRALRLLLVTAQQPRAVTDALLVAFAIAGLAVEIDAVEGLGALDAALADERSDMFAGRDLTLMVLPGADAPEAAATADLLYALAAAVAARSLLPVAIARFGGAAARRPDDGTVFSLDIALDGAPIVDDRFAATFGSVLTQGAADRLGDAAAGLAARLVGWAPKLVVTDLDETLWRGVLGEGTSAPVLHASYADALAALRRRGLVLALASRNDRGDVTAAFEAGRSQGWPLALGDFAASAVGWDDKPALVASVLSTLGLDAAHAVFVDDDPVNCAMVAAGFPAMDVRRFSGAPEAFAEDLLRDPLLAGAEGRDDGARRTGDYALRAAVERAREEAPDVAAFLRRLATTVTLTPLRPELLPRAAELAARVNQFRFTDLRPSVPALRARPGGLDLMARLDDAFGAHGLVGLALASVEDDDAVIDTLLLSCRALQRGVEGAMLAALARLAAARGLRRIVGRIEVLPRNEPARDCLSRYGFASHDGAWVYDLTALRPPALEAPPEGVTMQFDPADFGVYGAGASS